MAIRLMLYYDSVNLNKLYLYFRDFAYVARDNLSNNYMCHVFRCDTPARHIANTLRDICKKIMMERTLQQKALSRLTRPNDLPNLETNNTAQSPGEKMTFKSLYSSRF